jgi:hypothetical protein
MERSEKAQVGVRESGPRSELKPAVPNLARVTGAKADVSKYFVGLPKIEAMGFI